MSVETLGDWLQVKRLEQGISARKLAVALEISVRQLVAWERGKGFPRSVQLASLGRFFGIAYRNCPTVE
jgi:transcriptional regulator with XRE-family HTH domain